MEARHVTHALEDYLKAIYQLSEEDRPVIAARLAAETGVSPSTIFATLRRLGQGASGGAPSRACHLTRSGGAVGQAAQSSDDLPARQSDSRSKLDPRTEDNAAERSGRWAGR